MAPQDSDAAERKLRAVYDAFDSRNNKLALKLATAALQKHSDNQTLKALRAVGLDRTGKHEEALKACQELLAEEPSDSHVLHTLGLALKSSGQMALLGPAYERACAKEPRNEELLCGSFTTCVRDFDFVKQQQVALKLNKQFPSDHYAWWVIDSILLQARAAARATAAGAAAPAIGTDRLLQLACSMISRQLAKAEDGKIQGREAVMVYLGVLQAQGKADEALQVLEGPLGAAISLPAERREARAALLMAAGRLPEAAALYKEALLEQPDDWCTLMLWLDCLLPRSSTGAVPHISSTAVAAQLTVQGQEQALAALGGQLSALHTDDKEDAAIEEAQEVITNLSVPANTAATTSAATSNDARTAASEPNAAVASTSGRQPRSPRGPSLARAELAARQLQQAQPRGGDAVHGLQRCLAREVLGYYQRHGDQVSCAVDLREHLRVLEGDARAWLLGELWAVVEAAAVAEAAPKIVADLRRVVCALQIHADISGADTTPPAAGAQYAAQLTRLFAASRPLYAGLDERERGPADELLPLAAQGLIVAAARASAATNTAQGSPAHMTAEATTQADAAEGSDSASAVDSTQQNGVAAHVRELLKALLVLEAGVLGRPYGALVRLGLTALHGLLGCPAAAARHFEALDCKHIQLDTLSSHHLLPHLVGLGSGEAAQQLLKASLVLFKDHGVDAGDTLMQAYKHDTHTKVLEFVAFKERLEHAHTFALARAETAVHSISHAASSSTYEEACAAVTDACGGVSAAACSPPAWDALRFNQDFATRPAWLPPCGASAQLGVMAWWEQARSSTSDGFARCWWSRVSAAESSVPEAAAVRQQLRSSSQQRWLLPHLLAGAMALQPKQGECIPYAQALSQLAGTLASAGASVMNDAGKQANGSSSSSTPASRQLQLLELGLFTMAKDVQVLMGASTSSDASDVHTTSAQLQLHAEQLATGLSRLQQSVAVQLRASNSYLGVLPGDVLSLASVLTHETGLWILICLESWQKALKATRKRPKAKKGTAAQESQTLGPSALSAPPTVAALQSVQQALMACMREVQETAAALLEGPRQQSLRSLLAELGPAGNAEMAVLVGWEDRLSVENVLSGVLTEQHALLQQVAKIAGTTFKRLAAFVW